MNRDHLKPYRLHIGGQCIGMGSIKAAKRHVTRLDEQGLTQSYPAFINRRDGTLVASAGTGQLGGRQWTDA